MTRIIDGEKFYRFDIFHLVFAFIGAIIGMATAGALLDSRYVHSDQYHLDQVRLEQKDKENEDRTVIIIEKLTELRIAVEAQKAR